MVGLSFNYRGSYRLWTGGGIVRQMLPSFTKSTKWWRDSDVHTVPRAGTHKRGATCLNSLEFSEASIVPHRTIWSWYSGRWWVGCYIWYSKQGTGRDRSQSRPLLAVGLPSVTAHSSTASTYTMISPSVLLYNGVSHRLDLRYRLYNTGHSHYRVQQEVTEITRSILVVLCWRTSLCNETKTQAAPMALCKAALRRVQPV